MIIGKNKYLGKWWEEGRIKVVVRLEKNCSDSRIAHARFLKSILSIYLQNLMTN